MIRFSQYLKEQEEIDDSLIEVDSIWIDNNMERLNSELDSLTEKPYQNASIMLTQLRGVLERYGILLPPNLTKEFLNLSAEIIYSLGDSQTNLYMVYDTNDDGLVDGYAQIVTEEELQDLLSLNDEEKEELVNLDYDSTKQRPSTWYSRRDDDSGNSDEYDS